MEGLVKPVNKFYAGKKILITGHTGFKGSWLTKWLEVMGAQVCGLSLPPESSPNHFELLNTFSENHYIDIKDLSSVSNTIKTFQPEIIFHLAAQSLVRKSYDEPIDTYHTNVLGTLNLYQACRESESIRAIISITSDKCYNNDESGIPYQESDSLGGKDLYSSSKACVEILTDSFRDSFWNLNTFGKLHNTLIATCRSGNVIGGGDWSENRLIPDLVKAASKKSITQIRNSNSIRPWQHVLEPLAGYLKLAQKLYTGQSQFSRAWNFGPDFSACKTVSEVIVESNKDWTDIQVKHSASNDIKKEANILKLNSTQAQELLGWRTKLNFEDSVQWTIDWYKEYYRNQIVNTEIQIRNYMQR